MATPKAKPLMVVARSCISQNKMATPKAKLLFTIILSWLSMVLSMPPEEPIKCTTGTHNCTITNSIGLFPDRSVCKAGEAAYPTTEEELIAVVAMATKKGRKMRVATRYSHSIPKLVCLDGDDGLLISTKNLNKVLSIDLVAMTITLESGVTLQHLIEVAAKAGFALPHTPYWPGLSIGGLISTGAHGSSLWGKGSGVHDYVIGIRLVSPGLPEDGYVTIRNLDSSNEDLDAAKVSLGVLGVISQVTLQLEPLFKRSITFEMKDDHDLVDQVVSFGKLHEFGDLSWLPSQQKVIYKTDDRVPLDVPGLGRYDWLGFQPITAMQSLATIEENQESTHDANAKCQLSKMVTSSLLGGAYGLTNNGINFTGYPVVGYHNDLQPSASCLDSTDDAPAFCAWDSRIKGNFYHLTSLSIALSDAKSFLGDLKKLFRLTPVSTCGLELYNGILMRYVTASSAYLGKQEDSIEFDMIYYRSRDPRTPRLYEDILEEAEQIAIFKYGGLPHWGKNRNVAFEGVINKYKKGGEFLKVKEKYDPMSLFSNQWTDQVLGVQGGVTISGEGCGLEGLCVCSEDSHCAPQKGYFCRPGKVYKEARVCTLISYNKHTEL